MSYFANPVDVLFSFKRLTCAMFQIYYYMPTLFSIFIDDLVKELNNLGLGVSVGDVKVSALLYADDIALVSLTEQDMQQLLDTLHDWCKRWRVLINTDKSKVLHFRRGRRQRTEFVFKVGDNVL